MLIWNKILTDENHLDYALSLCLDGEKTDSEYGETGSEWRMLRYTIYERLNDIGSMQQLAKEFVIDGRFEYFLKLKELYATDDWTAVLEDLLQNLNNGRYKYSVYVQVLIHEKLKERILEYCKTKISKVVELYSHLLPEYADDIETLFLDYIKRSAEQASNRNQYHDICDIIKHYQRACGNKKANEVKINLLATYSKCPAFVDELRKIDLL